ncbi:hypothetical protein AeNC1_015347, partial [Aphanomyces euteiches]
MRVFLQLFLAAAAAALSHGQLANQVVSFEVSRSLSATAGYGALDKTVQTAAIHGEDTETLRSLRRKGRGRRGAKSGRRRNRRRRSRRRHLMTVQSRELAATAGGFMNGLKSMGRKISSAAGKVGRA